MKKQRTYKKRADFDLKDFLYNSKKPNTRILHFNEDVAKAYGVENAIMIQNIAFWVYQNKEAGRNFNQGRYWTYNTVESFAVLYSFWTYSQVRRILKNCVDQGALFEGNFNQKKYDRTKWYTVSDEVKTIMGTL